MGIRRILLTVSAIAGSLLLCSSGKVPADGTVSAAAESTARDLHKTLYETTGMKGEVSYAAFDEALTGYERRDSRIRGFQQAVHTGTALRHRHEKPQAALQIPRGPRARQR